MGVPNEDTRVAERHESELVRTLNGGDGPVSSVILRGFKTYEWSKQKAFESKRIAVTVGPAVGFFEDTFVHAAKLSPLKVDKVVSVMDSAVDQAMKHTQHTKDAMVSRISVVAAKPGEIKQSTLSNLHQRLESLRQQDEKGQDYERMKPEDVGFKVIYCDVQSLTDQGANKVLDYSEKYVDRFLHEEKNVEEEGKELGVRADSTRGRAFQLSKVVSKRMQKRAMSGLDSLKRRTQRVVHVDLMQYSKMLDLDATAKRFGRMIGAGKVMIQNRVIAPSRRVGTEFCNRYGDAKEMADRYQKQVRDRLSKVKVPFQDEMVGYAHYVRDTCDKRIVKPVEEVIETLKKDYEAEVKKLEKEQDPNKPLTIEAGARALVSAARFRMNVLMEKASSYVYTAKEKKEQKGVGKVRLDRVNGDEEEDEALYDAAEE